MYSPFPSFPHGSFKRINKLRKNRVIDGIFHYKIWNWQPSFEDPSFLSRLAYYLVFPLLATFRALLNSRYFDVVITAAEVKKGKPEPDVFLIAAKCLNIHPKNCIVVEDAPVGIEAAKRAGMISIALTTTHSKEELFGAQLIINDLSEITVDDIISLFN